jgi:hypothetical protein
MDITGVGNRGEAADILTVPASFNRSVRKSRLAVKFRVDIEPDEANLQL